MNSYTARLEDWYIWRDRIVGICYDDVLGRFPDGFEIHTSSIDTDEVLCEGVIVTTKSNNHYLLGKAYDC